MGYLVTQIALYMLATFLLGLLLGWLIWRYGRETNPIDTNALESERDALRRNRDDLNERLAELRGENADLHAALAACHTRCSDLEHQAMAVPAEPEVTHASAMVVAEEVSPEVGEPVMAHQEWRPEGIEGPRNGVPDDLQQIKGVGPKLEQLLHDLGFYHFDQIANWTENEVAWVDQNLEGFSGRVTRDQWVDQAREFASRR
ncbi:MAG: hypothetical protein AAF557_22710 [Pseudomonadota bacterium]